MHVHSTMTSGKITECVQYTAGLALIRSTLIVN